MYHLLPDRRTAFNSERTRPRINTGLTSVRLQTCLDCVITRILKYLLPLYSPQSIVCVGGEDDKVVLRSVESWDPVHDAWKQLSCLPFAVRYIVP